MDDTIRLKLQLLQFADAATARTLMGELEAQCRQNADAFEADQIGAREFGAAAKELQSAMRSVQSALAQFDDAEDELVEHLGQQVAAQIAAAESAERLAQAQQDGAAAAKSEADYLDLLAAEERAAAEAAENLAHETELQSAAIQHETAMLRQAADEEARAAASARNLADETREETEAAARWAQQQRDAAAAADHLEAANRDLNASLRDDAAAEARSRLAALDSEARQLTEAMARGDAVTDEMVASLNRLDGEAAQVRTELKGLESAAAAESVAMDHSAAASRRAGTAAHQVGTDLRTARQGALDLARSVQDLAQGGFGGILNNLEGLGRGIPALLKAPMQLLTNLPTVLTLVGVALYQFGPIVYHAFRGFLLGSNEIPKATDALGKVDGRLKEVTKQLDAYREAQSLTNREVEDYNRLSSEQILLERAKEKVKEEADERKKMREGNPAKEEEEKERAKLFEQTMGTPELREQLTKSVQASLPQDERRAELRKALEQAKADQASQVFSGNEVVDQARSERLQRAVDAAESQLNRFNQDIREQAEKLVTDAVIGGQRRATETIRGFIRQRPERFNDYQQFAFGNPNATNPDGTPNAAMTQEPFDAARRDKRSVEQQQRMSKLDKDLKQKQEKQQKADDAAEKWMADFEDWIAAESAKESKAATQEVLKRDKSSGATDQSAKLIAEFASKQLGLKEDALFDYVQAEMVKVLTGASTKAGVKTIDAKLVRDAARQAAGKALGRQEKAEETDEKNEEKEEAKDEKEATKERRKTVKDSGMEARAGALYAEARARGATDDQATDIVGQQVLAYLNRQVGTRRGKPVYANAGMSQDQKALLAAQITSQGKHEVQDQTKAMAGQNLTNTGKLLAVASRLNADIAAMEEKARAQQQQIDGLMREVGAPPEIGGPPMSDTFTVGGIALDLAGTDALPVRYQERFGSVPILTIQRRAIALPEETADPWMGQTIVWSNASTVYFSGRFRSRTPRHNGETGWIIDYQAYGLRDYLDRFPLTDATTLIDTSAYNLQPEDPAYNAARAGRTVGQILTSILTTPANANALDGYGLGNYTGLPTTPVLPSNTVADLAALTVIPPRPVTAVGEKFGDALDGLLSSNAPNIRMWIDPSDGSLRFINITGCTAHSLVQNSDPIEPVEISRDVSDCWQRLEIRGAPIAVMALLKQSQGAIVQNFAWGSHTTNASAIAAWNPSDFQGATATQDSGTCVMSSTTTAVVTSSNTAETWANDFWDNATGVLGTINLFYSAGAGATTYWSSRVVANTSLAAAGTSTITINVAAPNTNYDHYTLSGITTGASRVYRDYTIADPTLWPLVVAQSTYPQSFVNSGGGAALVTSTPMGLVLWPSGGSGSPDLQFPAPFVYDSATGTILFAAPTYITANNQPPSDVWVLLPINQGPNVVYSPQNSGGSPVYAGDSNSIEGLQDTLVITMADWRDPGQVAQVQAYADDYLLSVKDGRREGRIVYYGLYTPALTFGNGISIGILNDDGTTGATGWESANIPIVETEVEFSQGASDYVTTFTVSNRREALAADMFLRPERTWQALGLQGGEGSFSGGAAIGGASFSSGADLPTAAAQQGIAATNAANQAGVGGMSDTASQGIGGMAATNQQAMGQTGLDPWSGHGAQEQMSDDNPWLGTTGSHPERMPAQAQRTEDE